MVEMEIQGLKELQDRLLQLPQKLGDKVLSSCLGSAAGVIQAPSAYDPVLHYSNAKARQEYVLRGMVTTSAMSQSEAGTASAEDIQKELHIGVSARQSKAPHFVDFVLTQLESMFGSAAVQQGGLVVHTTLDLNLQALAQQAVAQGVRDLHWTNVNNGALLAADPKSGEVLAWVGSADYSNDSIGGQFDVVTAERQPGSSFAALHIRHTIGDN